MKKLLLVIIILIIPSTCFASYIIKLKSGSEIIVSRYWQEGDKIFFHAYGGTVGFPENSIESIYELSEKSVSSKNVLPEKEIKYKELIPDESQSEGEIDIDYYKNKKNNLISRLKSQQIKLARDISKGKAEMWIERRRKKIEDISTELDNLKNEITEKSNGIVPPWWNEIAIPEKSETQ
jgi:hypothetical protein